MFMHSDFFQDVLAVAALWLTWIMKSLESAAGWSELVWGVGSKGEVHFSVGFTAFLWLSVDFKTTNLCPCKPAAHLVLWNQLCHQYEGSPNIETFSHPLGILDGHFCSISKINEAIKGILIWKSLFYSNMHCMIYLHNEINEALVIVTGHRSVRPHHNIAINPGRQVDVLPCKCNNSAYVKVGPWTMVKCTMTAYLLHSPIGSPRTWSGDFKAKRNFLVSWLIILIKERDRVKAADAEKKNLPMRTS